MKKLIILLVTSIMLLSGCASKPAETTTTTDSGAKKAKVVYVTAGAMGDNGFTDYTVEGIKRIAADFGAETKVIENNNDSAKFSQSLEAAFQWGPDVVFADAYGFEELYAQYADKYPDVKVINLDFVIENEAKTVTSVTYINEEGSYLAGVLAAIVTTSDLPKANKDKKVGFVGGNDIPVIRQFEAGFIQGVKSVDPTIEVVSTFVGDFFDPIKGKQAAQQLYSQGVDIVFQAAGQTGAGVLEAAKDADKYAIGVDSNQNGVYPGHIPASMVKDLNNTVYQIYQSIQDGTYKAGEHIQKGAGIGGVYLAIDENSEKILTKEMIETIKKIETDISAGTVKVEKYKQ